jgi:hypothetical protein
VEVALAGGNRKPRTTEQLKGVAQIGFAIAPRRAEGFSLIGWRRASSIRLERLAALVDTSSGGVSVMRQIDGPARRAGSLVSIAE